MRRSRGMVSRGTAHNYSAARRPGQRQQPGDSGLTMGREQTHKCIYLYVVVGRKCQLYIKRTDNVNDLEMKIKEKDVDLFIKRT